MEDFDNDGLLDLAVTALRSHRAHGVLPQQGGRHLRGPHRVGRSDRPTGGQDLRPDRLQQRRPDGPVHLAGRLVPVADPADACCGTTATARSATSPGSGLARAGQFQRRSAWADYDNDGWLDVFIVCERQPNRLYHNRGDGTFEEVAAKAGVEDDGRRFCKGCDWIDYDNDDYPDLFVNNLKGDAQLYHNNRDGTFTDVTSVHGHRRSSQRILLLGLGLRQRRLARHLRHLLRLLSSRTWSRACSGQPHGRYSNRLFRNVKGKGFEDKTREAGLDMVFAAMGSNFGDFDNDGFLDMYLGTGDPDLST